jgi:hypothetical protein
MGRGLGWAGGWDGQGVGMGRGLVMTPVEQGAGLGLKGSCCTRGGAPGRVAPGLPTSKPQALSTRQPPHARRWMAGAAPRRCGPRGRAPPHWRTLKVSMTAVAFFESQKSYVKKLTSFHTATVPTCEEHAQQGGPGL